MSRGDRGPRHTLRRLATRRIALAGLGLLCTTARCRRAARAAGAALLAIAAVVAAIAQAATRHAANRKRGQTEDDQQNNERWRVKGKLLHGLSFRT